MTEDEEKLSEEAYSWIKRNHKKIIDKFSGTAEHVAETQPVTLFMAGSPGAGKTEVSKRLVLRFSQKPIRIDADEIRSECQGYTGPNAHIFQKAATKGVHLLYDYALKKNINVILDGTFAYAGEKSNIERSLKHGRKVEIYFVYQDPLQAWDFTKKREEIECRKVTKEVFIEAFLRSQQNVNFVKHYFGDKIELNLLIKDLAKDIEQLELNVLSVDNYLTKVYTKEELDKLLI